MYHLRNQAGNVYKITDSEQKRDALLREGWVEVTKKPKAGEVKAADKKPKAGEVKAE